MDLCLKELDKDGLCPLHGKEIWEEAGKLIDAHCFHCHKPLVFEKGYMVCPEHGKKWIPENARF